MARPKTIKARLVNSLVKLVRATSLKKGDWLDIDGKKEIVLSVEYTINSTPSCFKTVGIIDYHTLHVSNYLNKNFGSYIGKVFLRTRRQEFDNKSSESENKKYWRYFNMIRHQI